MYTKPKTVMTIDVPIINYTLSQQTQTSLIGCRVLHGHPNKVLGLAHSEV